MSNFTLAAMVILLSAIYLQGIKGEALQKRSLPSARDEKVALYRSTRQVGTFRTDEKVQLCHIRLIETLTKLCKGKFPTHAKRNFNENLVTRHRRSITDECCFKPCTISYLRTFCAPPETPTTPATPAQVIPKSNTSKQNPRELMGLMLNALLEKARDRAAGIPNNSGNWGNGASLGLSPALLAARPESEEAESISDDDGSSFDAGVTDDDFSSVFFVG